MTCYVWLAGLYLCVQLLLAMIIPLVLAIEGRYPIVVALMWIGIVMIVALGEFYTNQ